MKARTLLWLFAAAVVAAAGFFGGRGLHPGAERATGFDLQAAAYESPRQVAGFSRGGFSGFGELPGFYGRTVVAGRIVSAGATAIVIESAAGVRSTISITSGPSLRRIEAAGRDSLRPGASVVVRRQPASDTAVAVLVIEGP